MKYSLKVSVSQPHHLLLLPVSLEVLVYLYQSMRWNIIGYTCGYIGMKLHKKFICQDNRKTKAFVSWLDITHVAVESTTHESLLWYTREWINRINRGGLFEIKMEHIICFGIVNYWLTFPLLMLPVESHIIHNVVKNLNCII